MRVAALEDNVAFLEEWCEEQQDALDRSLGPVVAYDYELEADRSGPSRRVVLRVVDLRDDADSGEDDHLDEDDLEDDDGPTGTIVAVVESEHDRAVRQIRRQLNRLRTRLAATLAPASSPEATAATESRGSAASGEPGRPRRPRAPRLSEKPAGRTAP